MASAALFEKRGRRRSKQVDSGRMSEKRRIIFSFEDRPDDGSVTSGNVDGFAPAAIAIARVIHLKV